MNLKIMLDEGAFIPQHGHPADAGWDLKTPVDFTVKAKSSYIIDTGVHVEIPYGFVGMVKSKSGLNVNNNINTEGVIDAGYTGQIKVKIYNHGNEDVSFKRGNKITQLVLMPIMTVDQMVVVDAFTKTERGDNGFGSTGKGEDDGIKLIDIVRRNRPDNSNK